MVTSDLVNQAKGKKQIWKCSPIQAAKRRKRRERIHGKYTSALTT